MLKGFRASISHDYLNGIQGLWGDVYTQISFNTVLDDTSGRYDAPNARWTPVLPGEAPRYVMVGAKVLIRGGVRQNNPNCNCKIMRNGGTYGHAESNMPLSGTNGPIAGRLGQAEMQATLGILANPGDYFECWAMVSAAAPADPPLMYEFFRTCVAVDPHYGHTAFWGVVLDDSALVGRVTAAEAALVDLQCRVAALEGAV